MKILAFLALIFSFCFVSGQSKYVLQLSEDSCAKRKVEVFFSDSIQRSRYLDKTFQLWQSESYFDYQMLKSDDDSIVWIIKGERYRVKVNHFYLEGDEYQMSGKYRRLLGKGKWGKAAKEILTPFCNSGYPFATVEYQIVGLTARDIKVDFMVRQGQKFVWDSLVVEGNAGLPSSLLEIWLKTEKNKPFSAKSISNLEKTLGNNKLFKSTSAPLLLFLDSTVHLTLFLRQSKNDLFSGIAGFSSDPVSGKLKLNGEVLLVLNNSFRHADMIDLRWKSTQGAQSCFDLKVSLPFIFRQPLAAGALIKILKSDTSYINTHLRGGLMLLSNGTENGYELFVSRQVSSILSPSLYRAGMGKNRFLDFSQLNYGFIVREKKTDREINPLRGKGIELTLFAGNKKIIENNRAPEFYYDSLKMKELAAGVEISAFCFIPLGSNTTVNLRTNSAFRYGSNIPVNEFYLIGGLNDLRGFEENSIRAQDFGIINAELRYAFEEKSNIFVFSDMALAKVYSGSSLIRSSFLSFGLGSQIYTKQGMLNIVYALGKNKNESLLFKNSRIHIGYTLTF